MQDTPLFANWLGYMTIGLAITSSVLSLVALFTRRDAPAEWARKGLWAVAISVTVAVIAALSVHVTSWAFDSIYAQVFVAASLFTLGLALADWQGREPELIWQANNRLLYLGGQLGCVGLAVALVWMG